MKNHLVCIISLLLVLFGCGKNQPDGNDRVGPYYQWEIDMWNSYVGTMEGYDFPYASNMTDMSQIDTIMHSGLKGGKSWFALYRKSDKEKMLEWTDLVKLDTAKTYIFDKGYGERDEFKIKRVAPVFYKFYEQYEVVELTFGQSAMTGIYYCPNHMNANLGIGLSQDLIGGGGWYPSMQQVIFIKDRSQRITRDFTFYDSGFWPCHVANGYKESVFIGNECLIMNEVLYETNGPVSEINPLSSFFSSYSEVVSGYGLSVLKRNLDKTKETTVWNVAIVPPFEVPEGANPRIETRLVNHDDSTAIFRVNMVYYDGTKKEFSFSIKIATGEYSII